MQEYLYKYLFLNRKLSIPQLGIFFVVNEPAYINEAAGLLFAPRPVINFTAEGTTALPEKGFFDFLADKMNVDEVTALNEFNTFSDKIRNDLQHNKLALLPGLGRITKGTDDACFFTAETNLLAILPPIEPGINIRVTQKSTTNQPLKAGETGAIKEMLVEEVVETRTKDNWWIYAIILVAAGTLALLFYYQ